MANKYTAIKSPSREVLEWFYHECKMSQEEVGKIFNTTQKVVHSWFKRLGIESRVPAKRFQKGEKMLAGRVVQQRMQPFTTEYMRSEGSLANVKYVENAIQTRGTSGQTFPEYIQK